MMTPKALPILAAVAIACVTDTVQAQQTADTAPSRALTASAGRARSRAPYTGMNVGGRPQLAGGVFRWAEHPTVHTVEAGSPAARVGIRPGDVVLAINGADARDPNTLLGEAGKVFVIRLRRGASVREFTLTSIPTPRRTGTGSGR